MDKNTKQMIKSALLSLSETRGYEASYCPSEVARNVFSDTNWRSRMNDVRLVADELVNEGFLVVMQHGHVINKLATEAKGPIRLRKNQIDLH